MRALCILSVIAAIVPARSLVDASQMAAHLLSRCGLDLAKLDNTRSAHRAGLRGNGYWELTYTYRDSTIGAIVYDRENYVAHLSRVWQVRLPRAGFGSADAARAALFQWRSRLGFKGKSSFRFTEPDGAFRTIYPGAVVGSFDTIIERHAFVDRICGVSIAALPSGDLVDMYRSKDPPPTGEPIVKLNSRDAFSKIRDSLMRIPKYLNVGSGKPQIDQWHPTLGWYLPKGKKVCELGWRFQYSVGSFYYIVNAATGAVQRPIITG